MLARKRIPELMDDPNLDPMEHARALAGLARINWLTDSAGVLWPGILALARTLGRPVRVLDVATGSGDVPAELLRKAERAGVRLELAGCDISRKAVAVAAANCPVGRFFTQDAIREPLPTGFDVVICSLFLHHLSETEAVLLLMQMKEAAGQLVLVNDLVRSRLNLVAVWLVTHLASRSPVVRSDGPASVQSAFTPVEALDLARQAGLLGANIRYCFPCRFVLDWRRA
jgi:SAM-dependent methyltransferase